MAKNRNGTKKIVMWVSFNRRRPHDIIDGIKGQQFRVLSHSYAAASSIRGRAHDISEASVILLDSPDSEDLITVVEDFQQYASGNLSSFIIVNPIVPRADSLQARRNKMSSIVSELAQSTGKRMACVLSGGGDLQDKSRIIDLVRGDLDDVRNDPVVMIVDKDSIHPKAEPLCARQEICRGGSQRDIVLFISDEPEDAEVEQEFRRNGLIFEKTDSIRVMEADKRMLPEIRQASAIVMHKISFGRTLQLFNSLRSNGMESSCRIVILDPYIYNLDGMPEVCSLFGEQQYMLSGRQVMITIEGANYYWDEGVGHAIDFLKGEVHYLLYNDDIVVWKDGKRMYAPTDIRALSQRHERACVPT